MARKTRKKTRKKSRSSKRRKKAQYAVMYHDGAVYHVVLFGRKQKHGRKRLQEKTFRSKREAEAYLKRLVKRYKVPGSIVERRQYVPKALVPNLARDRARKALPPGKRISKSGKTYYEYRINHSDRPGTRV